MRCLDTIWCSAYWHIALQAQQLCHCLIHFIFYSIQMIILTLEGFSGRGRKIISRRCCFCYWYVVEGLQLVLSNCWILWNICNVKWSISRGRPCRTFHLLILYFPSYQIVRQMSKTWMNLTHSLKEFNRYSSH